MKSPADRARAYRVFLEALDLDPGERERFLDRQCGDDEAVRAEVATLLRISMREDARTQAILPPAPVAEADLTGQSVARFRLAARVGEGGMGVVYRAERTDGVQQSVAIKLVSATGSRLGQARFEREAQNLARLEHPNVARLIDAGLQDGRAWIAMEFVRGERIDEYCAARGLDERRIVRLLVQIADAIAAAHAMLVVHSDIKPTNVLVTPEGMPKLIDFGISTALREAGATDPQTIGVGRLFSPGYAAPEQVKGAPVTVATDVFGLGALAYRLLTGVPILPECKDPLAYMLAIAQREVGLPSRVAAAAPKPPVDPRRLHGDLDAILCKALERDPGRRYVSAADMQADLQRFLDRRPVLARRQSVAYRAARFTRRNALSVGLSGLLLLSLVAGGIALQRQSQREALARDMAARRGEFLENLLKSADPRGGRRDISVAELLDSAAAQLDKDLGSEPMVEASMLGLIASTEESLGRFDRGLAANERQRSILRSEGDRGIAMARAVATQALLLRDMSRWTDAVPVAREAVERLRPLRKPDELSDALDVLGAVLARASRDREAEAVFREEIDIESRGGPELQARRMFPYRALAILLGEQGRYPESAAYGREAVALAQQRLPPDHPDRLGTESNYAVTLVNLHRGAEAEALFREVIAVQMRVLGPEHKETLLTQYGLMEDLVDLHRDAEAGELAHQVALGLEKALGPDSMYTLGAWMNYGIAQCNLYASEEGLAVLRRIVAARRRLYPPGSWFIDSARVNVASCLVRMRRYAQAEALLRESVPALEASRGAGFHRTQAGYALLRDVYLATARPGEAAAWAAKIQPGPR